MSEPSGEPYAGPERRRRGRPSKPDEQKPQTIHVKVTADVYDAVSRVAIRREMAINALVRKLIERAVSADAL